MDLGISEKKAIVCASSRGLGKACAESLAKEGTEIIINGVNEENLKKSAVKTQSTKNIAVTNPQLVLATLKNINKVSNKEIS